MGHDQILGIVAGGLGALLIDLHAYSSGDGGFNWKKALARTAAGCITGFLTASGLSVAI